MPRVINKKIGVTVVKNCEMIQLDKAHVIDTQECIYVDGAERTDCLIYDAESDDLLIGVNYYGDKEYLEYYYAVCDTIFRIKNKKEALTKWLNLYGKAEDVDNG